jgi:phosphoesterase RecJ-like protein
MMATRVLIDHHCEPQPEYDLMFSYPESSSTAFLVYKIIESLGMADLIDETMATQIYTGIMTDTGNFSYGNLTPDLFCSVAKLMEKGINIPLINSSVFNNHSEKRMRLLGYMLNEKMVTIDRHNAAYLTLNQQEMADYEFQPGDSEGFVNYPLSIKHIRMSAFFMQTLSCIKVSLRSQGDIDVNRFARQYFNGGGHKNAAGGKSFYSMEKTVETFLAALDEFFGSQN